MNTFQVDVVSAEELIYSGQARFVALPGESGELGILPGHTPLITRIKPGAVRIERTDGTRTEDDFVFVAGGVLEVQPKHVTVLADTAIRGKDLDEAKAQEALKLAQDNRASAKDAQDIAVVEGELAMLAAQLAAIRKLRNRPHLIGIRPPKTPAQRPPAGFLPGLKAAAGLRWRPASCAQAPRTGPVLGAVTWSEALGDSWAIRRRLMASPRQLSSRVPPRGAFSFRARTSRG